MKSLLQDLVLALQPLLLAAVTAFVGMALRWIQGRTKNERIKLAEERLAESVMTIVKSLSSTVVKEVKAAKEDGQITPEEREKIKAIAMHELRQYWGAKGIEEMKSILGYTTDEEMKSALTHDIEAAVYDMKLEQTAAAAGGTVVPNPLTVK